MGSALVLAACGGGGGGGGGGSGGGANIPENNFRVVMTASRDQVALNIDTDPCSNPPSLSAPNASTIFIRAERRLTGDPITDGENVFACNLVSGLESGAMYFFRNDPSDQVEVQCPDGERDIEGAYRNIVLGANAGGNSFHVLGGERAGTVVVRCRATDSTTGLTATSDYRIQVGGASTGRPSQVSVVAQGSNFLFAQGVGGTTQRIYRARVVDEAGQGVRSNLIARIIPNPDSLADDDALIRASNGQSGKSVVIDTNDLGVADFTVISGSALGSIGVELRTDRADSNVLNGITETVRNVIQVPVILAQDSGLPLTIETASLPVAFLGADYTAIIEATGGAAPRSFRLLSVEIDGVIRQTPLPLGLNLLPSGVIVGTPEVVGDNFNFIIEVVDANGRIANKPLTLDVKASGGAGVEILTQTLPNGTAGVPYLELLEVRGGVPPYRWTVIGGTGQGRFTVDSGPVTSGNPATIRWDRPEANTDTAQTYTLTLQVTDERNVAATKNYSITISP